MPVAASNGTDMMAKIKDIRPSPVNGHVPPPTDYNVSRDFAGRVSRCAQDLNSSGPGRSRAVVNPQGVLAAAHHV